MGLADACMHAPALAVVIQMDAIPLIALARCTVKGPTVVKSITGTLASGPLLSIIIRQTAARFRH